MVWTREQGWTRERKICPSGRRTRALLANLTAEVAVFLVRK
jgi:hypothetical protein